MQKSLKQLQTTNQVTDTCQGFQTSAFSVKFSPPVLTFLFYIFFLTDFIQNEMKYFFPIMSGI